jgi:glucan biosynthesis protein
VRAREDKELSGVLAMFGVRTCGWIECGEEWGRGELAEHVD